MGVSEDARSIKSQDVVDALESQFDPSLDLVKGIRILGQKVFLCLKDQHSVKSLITAFGQGKALLVNNSYHITFHDGSIG